MADTQSNTGDTGIDYNYSITNCLPNSAFHIELHKVIKTFYEKYPNNFIIPTTNKFPNFNHKNGQYSWDNLCSPNTIFDSKNNDSVGLLLKDLIVIDIDDRETVMDYEELFPILKEVVREETKKGRHYFFKRSPLCNELQMFDLSRGLKSHCADGRTTVVSIDIKTVCSTGTAGLVIISPSNNKKWLCSPIDNDITEIPDDLVNKLQSMRKLPKQPKGHCAGGRNTAKPNEKKVYENYIKEVEGKINLSDVEQEVNDLVSILNPERSTHYDTWSKMCWCLYNIGCENRLNLFNVFDNFSKIDQDKYLKDSVYKLWKETVYNPIGLKMGTLHTWAKEDNEEKYVEFQKKNLKNLILQATFSKTDMAFAKIIKFMYPDTFIAVQDGASYTWYIFNEHRWRKNGLTYLRSFINKDIQRVFKELYLELIEEAEQIEDDQKKELKVMLANNVLTVSHSIENEAKAKNVEKRCGVLYSPLDNTFLEKLNENPNLLCFKNGVLDLRTNEFRDGRPEDYITFCTKISYQAKSNNEIRKKIKAFLFDIMGSREKVHYVMQNIRYILCGNKNREFIDIWIGKSRNGKGSLCALINKLLGDYCTSVNSDLITDVKNKAGAANPELVKTQGVRLIIMSEIENGVECGKPIQIKLCKSWCGRDIQQARGLYKDPIEFKPQFQLLIQVDDEPKMSSYEPAFIRKLEMLEFPFEFITQKEIDEKSSNMAGIYKLVNPEMKTFLEQEETAQEFLLMLLEVDANEINEVPDFIRQRNEKFINSNNIVGKWLNEELDVNPIKNEKRAKNDRILRKDLWDLASKARLGLSRNAFYKLLEEKNGYIPKPVNGYNYYYGIRHLEGETCSQFKAEDI
jgi:P4 family phage/plasmid primase-like protien